MWRARIVALVLAGALLLPGCDYPVYSPVCAPSNLVAPRLVTPIDFAQVASNTPLLVWEFKGVTYPSPGSPVPCHPDKYRVSLSTAPLLTDELGGDVPGAVAAWTTPMLQSGKTYRWSVTAISKNASGPTSVTRWFSVGNPCTFADLKAPILLSPPDSSIVHTAMPTFVLDTSMTCLPSGFLLRVSTTTAMTLGGTYGGPYSTGSVPWSSPLKDCTTYYWRAAAYVGAPPPRLGPFDGLPGVGPSSETWTFRVMLPGTTSCFNLPPPTPTATVAALNPTNPTWEVTMNANCRAGPGTLYNETGFALKGSAAPVQGRNEDGTWFQIKDPYGISCWVSSVALQVPQDWQTLTILSYPTPPPPRATPVPQLQCSHFSDIQTCMAYPPCTWDQTKQTCKQP